ncbi:MAG: hydroxymethylglutaryl-CoA lyase [Rhodospirillaceae bacterium]|jgi:hydroxymethylglutaryl-CoA lyase|uniref:hydroxymethylglutaryl-CoA lyase n=1 Tax=Hwanghaeella sp. 1Z406 TaxID=3402811 RepID=UPI000C4EE306|nr:hydroxymethylglutaryl-CoA lyase [Rhodospirillales bacterium]MAX48735.1 hydroxymethylglutaryl-CoA lyase [Rhodospirillaceae bacterium]|tara:strand:- start:1534 stop:2436 length:903 start_codon:yes stop_codon:yes gene_type:complete
MTDRVRIVEMGPRDGLQNEKAAVSTEDKIHLIHLLNQTGLPAIEVGSFVSPKWVPKMADSGQVFDRIEKLPGVSYPMLTPNMKGLEAALDHGVQEVAVFAAASESFSQRNINCSIAESIDRFAAVCEGALSAGLKVRGYISCVLGCPYEGKIAPDAVAAVAERLVQLGCYEVSLGDTIGTGTPVETRALIQAVSQKVPMAQIAGHFHDTYGQALANIWAALACGIRTFDSSVGGLGGCPYAKGATGNVATEDVVYSFMQSEIETGIDMERLLDAVQFSAKMVRRDVSSRVGRALLTKRAG